MNIPLSALFAYLKASEYCGAKAPHKAVLLIAVMDLIEKGSIDSPFVYLTDELIDKFHSVWNYYVGDSPLFQPDVCKPYYHLQHEPFWRLIGRNKADDALPYDQVDYTVKYLRDTYECAMLDHWLFDVLQDEKERGYVRSILISNYLMFRPESDVNMA